MRDALKIIKTNKRLTLKTMAYPYRELHRALLHLNGMV